MKHQYLQKSSFPKSTSPFKDTALLSFLWFVPLTNIIHAPVDAVCKHTWCPLTLKVCWINSIHPVVIWMHHVCMAVRASYIHFKDACTNSVILFVNELICVSSWALLSVLPVHVFLFSSETDIDERTETSPFFFVTLFFLMGLPSVSSLPSSSSAAFFLLVTFWKEKQMKRRQSMGEHGHLCRSCCSAVSHCTVTETDTLLWLSRKYWWTSQFSVDYWNKIKNC